MQCLRILLTPESVQYGVGFFSTLRLFRGTVDIVCQSVCRSIPLTAKPTDGVEDVSSPEKGIVAV